MTSPVAATALISECGSYRYRLARTWDEHLPRALFVMLNPSTADAVVDDRTIEKIMRFSRLWGMGGLDVVNVFALRSRDPQALRAHPDPVGPDNDSHIEAAVAGATVTVVAWGQSWPRQFAPRIVEVGAMLSGRAHHLGLTNAGQPTPLVTQSTTAPNAHRGAMA